ncbi:EF-hand domain-containing protein [Hyphomonas sp.]|uniref:EF-hand domain-containing protein n=1 Tax=Hyphomonas sp. TaxID=87 RepID=UPI00391AD770
MKRTSILAAGLFTAALAAHAGEMPGLPSYDTDGDGQISQAEFVTAKVATGKVTEEEAAAKFADADTNYDGYLSEAEYTAAAEAWKAAKEAGQ